MMGAGEQMKLRRTDLDRVQPRLAVADDVAHRTKRAASSLRRRETESERILWKYLRAGHLNGRTFRRQHAIGPFVVDFYCASERLVVEIDGGVHSTEEQHALDASRQRAIEDIGVRVVRVSAEAVTNNAASALCAIEAAFKT
jgi:very-short-patch-repair endonuclease